MTNINLARVGYTFGSLCGVLGGLFLATQGNWAFFATVTGVGSMLSAIGGWLVAMSTNSQVKIDAISKATE